MTSKPPNIRVAVTGVGGGIGQSVMKALSISDLDMDVVAVDVQPFSAGLYRSAERAVLPRPECGDALGQWRNWLEEKHIDVLIPASDHDLPAFATVRDRWMNEIACCVMLSDETLVATCRDKAETSTVLAAHGIATPETLSGSSLEEAAAWAQANGYPIVLKPRDGFASRNVHIIQDDEELRFYFPRTPNPIVQEYLSRNGDVEEFTCSVFVDGDGEPVGTFMARRDLSSGATYRAEVGHWPDIEELLLTIGRALRPRGPLNVQLRRTQRGPVPFELNIRCSGTSAIRAHYGYNEPEMLIRHYFLGEAIAPPPRRSGYVLRYWNEVFLDDVSRDAVAAVPHNMIGTVRAWP